MNMRTPLSDEVSRETLQSELDALWTHSPLLMAVIERDDLRVRKISRESEGFGWSSNEPGVIPRFGEVIRCIHRLDDPAGCGYGPACERCAVRLTALDTLKSGRPHHKVFAPYEIENQGQTVRRWFEATTACVELGGDSVVFLWLNDITKRQEALNAVVESEQRYRSAIEAAGAVPYVRDHEHNVYEFVGAGVEELTGYTPAEFTPDLFESLALEIIPVGELAGLSAEDARRLAMGNPEVKWTADYRLRTRAGQVRWVANTAVHVPDEHKAARYSVGILQDITSRKEAEAAVEQQLRRTKLLNEIAHSVAERTDLISILDVALRHLEESMTLDFCGIVRYYQDDDTLELLAAGANSWQLGEALGFGGGARIAVTGPSLRRAVNGEVLCLADLSQLESPFAQTLVAHHVFSAVLIPLTAQGAMFGLLVGLRQPRNGFTNDEVEFLTQVTDHLCLAIHHSQLYRELQHAYKELQDTQHQVIQQERLRALGTMASGVAHDFNNALMPVVGYTDLMLVQPDILDDRQRALELLRTVNTAARDASAVVTRLREFYREREDEDTFTKVELFPVVQEAVSLTQPKWRDQAQSEGRFIAVQTHNEDAPPVYGANAELREVFTNVILNAVDAMPEGGDISVHTHAVSTPAGQFAVIEIADTGEGMDPETLRNCLEPFFTTKGEQGTGLGLSMVYGIIRRHGGRIEIDSEKGQGTTFRFYLPAYTGQEPPPIESTPVSETVAPLRVLVVDDERAVREVLTELLRLDGHHVETAANGKEALEVFRTGQFDLVITDRSMPEMNGVRAAAALKQLSPDLPIIMATGFGDLMRASNEMPDAVDVLLTKPVTAESLRRALRRAVSRGVLPRPELGRSVLSISW